MKTAILSVIILTYNHEKSIAKCIESVIRQKTDYCYEIHICEDCSTDNTAEICHEYGNKYPDKIKLFLQETNTGMAKDSKKNHFLKAIQRVNTKYWCYIDGDDWWCDENKIQISLDFLEQNPDYMGFCHDTIQRNEITGEEVSYVHDCLKLKNINKIEFKADAPFLLTSSRIFRRVDFDKLNIIPADYLVYYYHLSRGPFYYYDKKMAVYNIGNGFWTSLNGNNIRDFNFMFPYKLSKLFNFKQDEFCTEYLKHMVGTLWRSSLHPYKKLIKFKRLFGVRFGWHLWFIYQFIWRYGLECLATDCVIPRSFLIKVKKSKMHEKKIFSISVPRGKGKSFILSLSKTNEMKIENKKQKIEQNEQYNLEEKK